jgi:hypothetical protein
MIFQLISYVSNGTEGIVQCGASIADATAYVLIEIGVYSVRI